jgi:hypothetical protein
LNNNLKESEKNVAGSTPQKAWAVLGKMKGFTISIITIVFGRASSFARACL